MFVDFFRNLLHIGGRLAIPRIFRDIPDGFNWIDRNFINPINRALILGQRANHQIPNNSPGNLNPQNAVNGNGKDSRNFNKGDANSSLEPDLDTLINSIIEFDVLEVFLASFLYLRILVFLVITLRFFIMFYPIICTYFKVYTQK